MLRTMRVAKRSSGSASGFLRSELSDSMAWNTRSRLICMERRSACRHMMERRSSCRHVVERHSTCRHTMGLAWRAWPSVD